MSMFHLFFRAAAAAPAATFLASSNDRLFFVRSSPEAVPAKSIVDRIKAPIPPNFLSVAIMCTPPRVGYEMVSSYQMQGTVIYEVLDHVGRRFDPLNPPGGVPPLFAAC